MKKCIFCDGKLEKFLIKKFNYWTVYLNEDQYYLGRIYVALNRHGPEDTVNLTDEEWKELKLVNDSLTKILKSLYDYDLISYLTLQNKDRNHFHVHIIPRYKDKREFYGREFEDKLWGKAPIPTPKKEELGEEILIKIKEDIKKLL